MLMSFTESRNSANKLRKPRITRKQAFYLLVLMLASDWLKYFHREYKRQRIPPGTDQKETNQEIKSIATSFKRDCCV
jgi:hypothetical protein